MKMQSKFAILGARKLATAFRRHVFGIIVGLSAACGGGTDSVTVQPTVTAVTINPATLTLTSGGQTASLVAALTVQNGPLTSPTATWSSSNPAVATVTANGLAATVTSVGTGTATITATVAGVSGTTQVTVAPATYTLSVVIQGAGQGSVTSTPAGLTCTGANCTGTFATGTVVTLQATAASGSLLSAWGGACTGNTTCAPNMTADRAVTVTFNQVPVASVAATVANSTLVAGQTTQATAVVRAADGLVLVGRTVAWSSANTQVATVSGAGVVTALSPGTAIISALSEGITGTVNVSVTVAQATLVGNWVGTYACAAPFGSGRMTLSVASGNNNVPDAQLSFYDSPVVPLIPFGSFRMRGTLAGSSLNFDADETDWIWQPSASTTTFDLRGSLSPNGLTYSGTIPQPGCTTFTLTKVPATNGLVAYYPFTGNANDASGNGFHGIAYSTTLIADRHGSANAAYDFVAPSSVVAPVYIPSTSISVSAWIRIRTPRCWGGILDGFINRWEFVLDCASGDRLEFAQWLANSTFVDHVDAPRLELNRWYHAAVTIDGTQGRFYIDGLPTTTFTLTAPALGNPALLSIGHSASGTSQYFDGALDDIRLYNRPLSATEIRELCRSEAAAVHSCKTTP